MASLESDPEYRRPSRAKPRPEPEPCPACAKARGKHRMCRKHWQEAMNDGRIIPHSCTTTVIRGVTYHSMGAAARALGVAGPTLVKAFEEGWSETVGLGPATKSRGKQSGVIPKTPMTFCGKRYESIAECSRKTGIRYEVLCGIRSRYRERGTVPSQEYIARLVMEGAARLARGDVPTTTGYRRRSKKPRRGRPPKPSAPT